MYFQGKKPVATEYHLVTSKKINVGFFIIKSCKLLLKEVKKMSVFYVFHLFENWNSTIQT